eukprot:scaffold138029_cov16-Tisochrysis_lutea.AAC.3
MPHVLADFCRTSHYALHPATNASSALCSSNVSCVCVLMHTRHTGAGGSRGCLRRSSMHPPHGGWKCRPPSQRHWQAE